MGVGFRFAGLLHIDKNHTNLLLQTMYCSEGIDQHRMCVISPPTLVVLRMVNIYL